MTARDEALRALAEAIVAAKADMHPRTLDVLDRLTERLLNLPTNTHDDEYRALADLARGVQARSLAGPWTTD